MGQAAQDFSGVSLEEFLETERVAHQRHELVGGRVYAMAGGSERHSTAAALVYEALAGGARAAGCRPFVADRLLHAGDALYYPDVLVVCGPAGHRLYETDATLVVEVSSPSTRTVDRREKAAAYARLDSLRLYVLLDPVTCVADVGRLDADGQWAWRERVRTVVDTDYGPIDLTWLSATLAATVTTD